MNLELKLRQIRKLALDALFPIFCLGCGKEGTWICHACFSGIRTAQMNLCPGCGRASAGGATHGHCRERTPLGGLVALYPYANPLVRGLIKAYKYRHAMEAEEALFRLLRGGAFGLSGLFPAGAKIVPVPLHPSRERERGFNQAERLGEALGAALGAPTAVPLSRTRKTREQARLSVADRSENCREAFSCEPVEGDFILVDDVATTGATLGEAARALREAGARNVLGFALAHG